DEPLFEISTDKVDAEIPAPTSGVLQEIKVAEGNTVQVNTVVGSITTDGEGAAAPAKAPKAAEPAPAPPKSATPAPVPTRTPEPGAPPTRKAQEKEEEGEADPTPSSPLGPRLARDKNVDPARVQGRGMGGRITKQDIMGFNKKGTAAPALQPVAA